MFHCTSQAGSRSACLEVDILYFETFTRASILGPAHTNAFSFENAYFFIPFRLPSTLIRSETEVYVCENGGFRKRALEWRFLKTAIQRLCVNGRKRRFSKTITSLALACPELKKQNGCFLIRFRWSSVDGRKRCKNFLSVFKKQNMEVFENALMWTGP